MTIILIVGSNNDHNNYNW